MKTSLLIILLFIQSFFAKAQNEISTDLNLRGTIGEYPIAMHLSIENNEVVDASYFYEKNLKNIQLNGELVKGSVILNFSEGKNMETFRLKFIGKNTLKGTWTKESKRLPVMLRLFHNSEIKLSVEKKQLWEMINQKEYENNALNLIKLDKINFRRDSVTKIDGKEYVWFTETFSNIPFFRLGNGFTADARNNVNPKFDFFHYEEAIVNLGCSSPFGDGNYDINTDITYASNDLIGFDVHRDYYCGGAYPDFNNTGYLYDLHSGKEYRIDEILKFGDLHTNYKLNEEQWFKYRDNQVAPQLLQLIMKNKDSYEDLEEVCDYFQEHNWNFFDWIYTKNGIAFIPSYPHVAAVCRIPFLIPFSDLKQFKNPSFPYELK